MNNCLVLATHNHPWFETLKTFKNVINLGADEVFEYKGSHYQDFDFIFDFSLFSTEKKHKLLHSLNFHFNKPIISDFSTVIFADFLKRHKNIIGGISGVFHSPKNAYEYFATSTQAKTSIIELFTKLNFKPIEVSENNLCFHFPRVLSMIINEAYFAHNENLANSDDIDKAMQFGLNHPLGPFSWAKKTGEKNIVRLLDELYTLTKEPRYRVAPNLRILTLESIR